MNAEQNRLLIQIDERTKLLVKRREEHEGRLRSLERFRNLLLGAVAAIGAVVGYKINIS